jgi:hypothetical protein
LEPFSAAAFFAFDRIGVKLTSLGGWRTFLQLCSSAAVSAA